MIRIHKKSFEYSCHELVYHALKRSCASNTVLEANNHWSDPEKRYIDVFVDPGDDEEISLNTAFRTIGNKIIIFGRLPASLQKKFDFKPITIPNMADWFSCSTAKPNRASKSSGKISYNENIIGNSWARPLCRFDFLDEWNNLGYGRINYSGAWGICHALKVGANDEIATIEGVDGKNITFAARFDREFGSLLWINRSVGTIDSPDWRVVEDFISCYRANDLPCVPVISEIPFGYDAAVTMRLDCDEDIKSAEPLMELYNRNQIPMSLAITTWLLEDKSHHSTLRKLIENDGGLLSHSHTHMPRWGGDYENAYNEAICSKTKLMQITGIDVKHMVAPFHHAPPYALRALAAAGYTACVGGSMNHDPEFVMSRSGQISRFHNLIGHSQQSMLHGHTIFLNDDKIKSFKDAFHLSRKSGSWYGYLDHPFSSRYSYDWESENHRLNIHQQLINFIGDQSNVLFTNENICLNFLQSRMSTYCDQEYNVKSAVLPPDGLKMCYRLKGNVYCI